MAVYVLIDETPGALRAACVRELGRERGSSSSVIFHLDDELPSLTNTDGEGVVEFGRGLVPHTSLGARGLGLPIRALFVDLGGPKGPQNGHLDLPCS